MTDFDAEKYAREHACIGCSHCCSQAPCTLGLNTYGLVAPPCPGLRFHDERWWCAVVEDAEGEDKENLKDRLYIGAGCCSQLNTKRQEMIEALQLRRVVGA